MEKEKTNIKGSCEMCGFAYKGSMETNKGVFRVILCNKCNKETYNFDTAEQVDANDKIENYNQDYTKVDLIYAN